MFAHALRVTLALLLFRGGPQDFPYSVPLSRAAAAIAVSSSLLLMAPLAPLPMALAAALGGAGGLAFFTRSLLRARRLENRLAQTLGAQYLAGALFAFAMWLPFQAMAPSFLALMQDPEAMEKLRLGTPPAVEAPAWAALLSDLLFFWSIAVSVRINRLAADLSMTASVLLTLVGLFVMLSFVVFAQLLAMPLLAMFGDLPATAPAAAPTV